MNKQDITAVVLLVALLFGWLAYQNTQAQKLARQRAAEAAAHTNVVEQAAAPAGLENTALSAAPEPAAEPVEEEEEDARPGEAFVVLSNATLRVTLSSHGGVIASSTLLQYRSLPAKDSAPVAFDYGADPVLAWSGVPGLAPGAAYEVVESGASSATFAAFNRDRSLRATRRYELLPDHSLEVVDTLENTGEAALAIPAGRVSLGGHSRGASKNETLGVDFFAVGTNKVSHLAEDFAKMLGASKGVMGCFGGNKNALCDSASQTFGGPGEWVAVKSRFFAHFFAFDTPDAGLDVTVGAELGGPAVPARVSAALAFPPATLEPGAVLSRKASLYIGPKRLAKIKTLGPQSDQIMEFGYFAFGLFAGLCKLLILLFNFFYALVPNYGVAIILLTFLVRAVFWPLTHKTAESSRRMAALQPKIKELQAKFKDNPQKLQQETWALYREHKVNPLSSCLPMFIQLPVFIALFTVLRTAVELRFAPFLWVADLSEPENLLAGVLPLPLNILPILMAATMALQSYLTPSMGDPAQQKMMMIMMPGMMLVMFYNFASALALYWTVSQLMSILQLHWQRRRAARENAAKNPQSPADDAPATRQMRRRMGRE